MKKNTAALPWYLLILLAALIALTFGPASGRGEERPSGGTSGDHPVAPKKPEGMSEMFQGTVAEVIEAGRHIYVLIHTGERQLWVAAPAFDGKPGDEVLVPPGIPYSDFFSKKLNRRFKTIIFVGGIRCLRESRKK